MKTKKQLRVVSSSNFLRGYGGIQYLSASLTNHGIGVEVFAPIPPAELHETIDLPFKVHSILAVPWRRSLRLTLMGFRIQLLTYGLGPFVHWLFTDLSFYRQAVTLKRLRPEEKLIHYCPEFLTPEEFPSLPGTRFYAKHANRPDLIIDVVEERASRRRERFNLTKEVAVLPNTLPLAELPPRSPVGGLAKLAGGNLPSATPIVIYAGGTHRESGLSNVVSAIENLNRPVFLLLFCHGENPRDMEDLRKLVSARLGPCRGRVCDSVSRRSLRASLHEAALGLVLYPHSQQTSFNQLYCAPTKVFEYFAAGLPVVASANPPLQRLVASRGFGVCTADDGVPALRDALEELLNDPDRRKRMGDEAGRAFANELCFERASQPLIQHILAMLS